MSGLLNRLTSLLLRSASFFLAGMRRLPFSLYTKVLLFSIGVLSITFSLVVRLVYQGPYYPGWDVLGPAQGLYLVSNHSAWESLTQAFHATRHFQLWNSTIHNALNNCA